MELRTAKLGTQLHVHRHPDEPLTADSFKLVQASFFKPPGLWTSTDGHPEGWVGWCLSEQPNWLEGYDHWLLEPDPDARIALIDTLGDLVALCDAYPDESNILTSMEHPDWDKMMADFDAVHLTAEGQWATRMSHPHNLYGWDCESTCWWRWKFLSVENVGPRTYEQKEDAA